MKKIAEPIPTMSKAQELLDFSLELSKLHLARLREKARSSEGLSPHEGNCIGQYVKTFSSITKLEREDAKEDSKDINKMTDEELKQELAKYAASVGAIDE